MSSLAVKRQSIDPLNRAKELWEEYDAKPSERLVTQIYLLQSSGEIIEKLHGLTPRHGENAIHVKNLVTALLNVGRLLEASYFCSRLTSIEPSADNYYLLGMIASYRSDLVNLNLAWQKLVSPEISDKRELVIRTAALFCARRIQDAGLTAHEMIAGFSSDMFVNELAAYIAIEVNDSMLAKIVATNKVWAERLNPRAHLTQRLMRLVRSSLLEILKESGTSNE